MNFLAKYIDIDWTHSCTFSLIFSCLTNGLCSNSFKAKVLGKKTPCRHTSLFLPNKSYQL